MLLLAVLYLFFLCGEATVQGTEVVIYQPFVKNDNWRLWVNYMRAKLTEYDREEAHIATSEEPHFTGFW